jgi:hypothetical protein
MPDGLIYDAATKKLLRVVLDTPNLNIHVNPGEVGLPLTADIMTQDAYGRAVPDLARAQAMIEATP